MRRPFRSRGESQRVAPNSVRCDAAVSLLLLTTPTGDFVFAWTYRHRLLSQLQLGLYQCFSFKEFSRLGAIRTTGPFQNAEAGASFQYAPAGYRIASSQ